MREVERRSRLLPLMSENTTGSSSYLPAILKHLDKVPREFTPGLLGSVTRCLFDGEEIPAPELRLSGKHEDALSFSCNPPTADAGQQSVLWETNPLSIETSKGFVINEAQVISGIERLSFRGDGSDGEVVVRCSLHAWTAAIPAAETESCAWVSLAGFKEEPRGLMHHGNLFLKDFPGIRRLSHWKFRGRYTILLVKHEALGWVVVVDTGDANPPDNRKLHGELTLIGVLIGHPIHLPMLHRLTTRGEITAHKSIARPYIGASEPLWGAAVPVTNGRFSVAFFDRVMEKVKQNPEMEPMILVPLGHYIEGHDGSIESQFARTWIGLEALTVRAELRGLFRRTQETLANKEGWIAWVNDHRTEIGEFANPGQELAFLNAVKQYADAKPTKVRVAFEKLGITWTPEMDAVGALRGQYIHEGSPRERGYKNSMQQINLLRTMLLAIFARVFEYTGPITDLDGNGVDAPSWWNATSNNPEIEYYELQVPPG